MLWRALKHVEKGRYVDVGAQDPEVDSVSKLFFDRGWNGVHVEPSSHYANLLRAARPSELVMQVAVGAQSTVSKFFEFADTGLSTSDPEIAKEHVKAGFSCNEIAVPYVRLDEVFAQAGDQEIHWLKIDVEGGELDVIKGWRSEKVRPWVVLIESTRPLTQIQSHAKWERLLLKKGYQFVYFDGLNRFYISNSHPELAEFFSSGPNLFDDFSLTRRARPWCEYVDSQLSVIEADLEASQQAAKALFAEREAEWSRLLSAERERREQLRTENEVALKQAHEKLILAQDMAASASQAQARIENGYAESLAKGDLVPRRDLDNLAKRADQLSAQLDSVRLVSESERADLNAKLLAVHQQLAARDAELTSLRESAEQERRHHAQQLEIRNELLERERENVLRLDAQLCTLKAEMSQRDADLLGMHSKIASLDAELLAKRAASE
ncbi:MAG: FkbM family methyltransferase, partial [Burkholderiales bacterium]